MVWYADDVTEWTQHKNESLPNEGQHEICDLLCLSVRCAEFTVTMGEVVSRLASIKNGHRVKDKKRSKLLCKNCCRAAALSMRAE